MPTNDPYQKELRQRRNGTLFLAIADAIETEPDSYDQNTWGDQEPLHAIQHGATNDQLRQTAEILVEECDTCMCIAGHAAALSGYHPTMTVNPANGGIWGSYEWVTQGKTFVREAGEERPSTVQRVDDVALQLLGLDPYDNEYALFQSNWLPAGATEHSSPEDLARCTADALRKLAEGAPLWTVSNTGVIDYD